MCCTQTSPQEESYGKDPENSPRGGGFGDDLGDSKGDDIGVEQQEQGGDGAEEHQRYKRQARVDWTFRRSRVSKMRYTFRTYGLLL